MANSQDTIIPFSRRPRLIFAPSAFESLRFDPYALLGLPTETTSDILLLSSAPEVDLKHRTAVIREAYIDLASRLHPDARGDADCKLALWVSDAEAFALIAGAHRLLLDLELTLMYHAALTAASPAVVVDSSECRDVVSFGMRCCRVVVASLYANRFSYYHVRLLMPCD